jgi:hypothetical protein
MNTTDHFTLNGTTSKIDFKTTYKIPTAGTADAVAYSGITGIPASWTDAQIPALAISKISLLQDALDEKAPTSHTHTIAQITGLDTALNEKQGTLIAGTGITILGNEISAPASGGGIDRIERILYGSDYFSAGVLGMLISATSGTLTRTYTTTNGIYECIVSSAVNI